MLLFRSASVAAGSVTAKAVGRIISCTGLGRGLWRLQLLGLKGPALKFRVLQQDCSIVSLASQFGGVLMRTCWRYAQQSQKQFSGPSIPSHVARGSCWLNGLTFHNVDLSPHKAYLWTFSRLNKASGPSYFCPNKLKQTLLEQHFAG